ncbi:MAG: efflux RND transporter permease subunit [Bacteroidetes bacterium]|nr:efflux RND transporter permease subunit [Bacteroidota bacterium]
MISEEIVLEEKKIKNYFHTHKHPVTLLMMLVVLGGVFCYSFLKTSLFPEITFPKVKIIADAGQQPVEKMMVTVTRPLELAIKQVQDLKMIRSTTTRGSCEISAFLDWHSDIDVSQQRIESKINQVRNLLPPDIQITVEKMNPSILPVMGYSLESKRLTPIELKRLALYTIQPFLSQVEGVSEIRIQGGKSKEYRLILDQSAMAALGITPEAVSTAISQTGFVRSNGYLNDFRRLYLTVTDAQLTTIDDIKSLVISNNGKRILTLGDVADVEVSEAREYVVINANGKDGLLIGVIKQPNANLVDLSSTMKKKITDLEHILPTGVKITPYYIQSDFVEETVTGVSDSIWIGLLLAIIVVILFLRSFKASATVLIIIPLTLFLTLIVFYTVGFTINIMSLGALAASMGLIIDDAIVVVEQIHRTREENPGESAHDLVRKAIHYLLPSMVGSSVSTIVIFLPFLLMSGVAGEYFKVMTNAMIIILVCSFFVTWIFLLVVYLWFFRHGHEAFTLRSHSATEVKRRGWVAFFIHRPFISLSFILLLGVMIFVLLPRLETGFLPEMDEGSIVMDYTSPPGTTLEETDHILKEVEKTIIAVPEVETFSRRTGTQMGFFITEPNTGDYLITLKKERSRTTDEVINDIRGRIEASQPALRIDFGQVIGDMLGDLMSSVQPVEVKIFGDDRKTLQKLSAKVAGIVEQVKGTADVFDGIVEAGPSIIVTPYYKQLALCGITPDNLQLQVQTALEGTIVGSFVEKEQLSPIRITYPGQQKTNVNDLRKIRIFTPSGRLKSLSDLACITLLKGETEINREDLQNEGLVTARLDRRDLGSVMKDVQQEIKQNIPLPSGYHIQYGGSYAEQKNSFTELLTILILACLLVFCDILFLFRDFRISFIILLIAVLGVSGSILMLFLTNTPLNVGSYTGLIMIVGILGENAIFTFQQFKTSLVGNNTEEAIISAISIRLRPNLMTALGAIVALIPLAIGLGTGVRLHQPLAIAIIGGFLIGLPLILVVLPSLMILAYRGKKAGQSLLNQRS